MANYSTDADLEKYRPDILAHGLPEPISGGVSTTLDGNAAAAATTFDVASATGIAAGDFLRLDTSTNTEIIKVGSIGGTTVTVDSSEHPSGLRKNHISGADVVQVIELGFSTDHASAKDDIDRILEIEWYLPRLNKMRSEGISIIEDFAVFDPDLLLTTSQFTKWSAFYTLGQYVLPKFSKFTTDEDTWERLADEFMEKAEREKNIVLARGIDYDWDESGAIEVDERRQRTNIRRIRRA